MSDPLPPDEWGQHVGRPEDRARPPRPDVVTIPDGEQTELPAEHEPSAPAGVPVHRTPDLAPPGPPPQGGGPPRWRRPPGQEDDVGEPTASR
jgi:hypothetical protein